MTFVELWPLACDGRRHFFFKQVRELRVGLKECVCACLCSDLKDFEGTVRKSGRIRKEKENWNVFFPFEKKSRSLVTL